MLKWKLYKDIEPSELTIEEVITINAYLMAAKKVMKEDKKILEYTGCIGYGGDEEYSITKTDNKWHIFLTERGNVEDHLAFNNLENALNSFIKNDAYVPFVYETDTPIVDGAKRLRLKETFNKNIEMFTRLSKFKKNLDLMESNVYRLLLINHGHIDDFVSNSILDENVK